MKVKAKEKKKIFGAYFRLKQWKPSKKPPKKIHIYIYRREGIGSKFNELYFAAKILRAW